MTPAPTGRTGDGYPGRGVPPRPDRPQGPPRSREVPRPRPPQDPRQGPAAEPRTPWDDYSDPNYPTTSQPQYPGQQQAQPQYPQAPQGRDPRAGRQRDPRDPSYQPRPEYPQNGRQPGYGQQPAGQQQPGHGQHAPSYQQSPSFQRVDRAAQDIRSLDETHVPRGTRRRMPQNPEDLRPAGVPGPQARGNEYSVEYSTGLDQDEYSSGYQDGYGEDGAHDGDLAESGERDGRGHRRAGARRKDRLSPAQRRRRKIIFRTCAGILAIFVFLTSYSLYGALSAPGMCWRVAQEP